MKKGIHPEYEMTKITCACGNVIETRSTVKDIQVKFVQAAIRFLPVSRNLWIPPEESKDSTGNTVSNRSNIYLLGFTGLFGVFPGQLFFYLHNDLISFYYRSE